LAYYLFLLSINVVLRVFQCRLSFHQFRRAINKRPHELPTRGLDISTQQRITDAGVWHL